MCDQRVFFAVLSSFRKELPLVAPNSLLSKCPGNGSTKQAVLNLIRFASGGVSRAEIARQLGLSRAAITSIVNDLLDKGLIREGSAGPATGGRRPVLLEINFERGKVVGIDIGATHLTTVLADFSAQVLYEIDNPFDVSQGPKPGLAKVDAQVHALLEQTGHTLDGIQAIGVGVPGPVVAERGMVIAPPIMPGWSNFPIREYLQDLWATPVTLNNDAELGALGEWAYGVGRGISYLLYIKVGYGIGAGLLFDGKIYHGATGSAGEIGHITIDSDGPLCSCGNRGCLGAMASGRAIAERAKNLIEAGYNMRLGKLSSNGKISGLDVASAAQRGDTEAQDIVREAGDNLGIALASLVNMMNPQMIVIGGRVTRVVGDLFLGPVRQTIKERSLRVAAQDLRINAAVLGHRSTSMGAVVQALTLAFYRLIEEDEE